VPRILVVYYSRSSHTWRVAEKLAADCGADLETIVDPTNRSGVSGYLRSGFQAFFQRLVPIGPSVHNPAAYDLVVIGTPIWDRSVSSPVHSYLQRHRSAFPPVAFFCTCGGMGSVRVFRQMTEQCGREPVATMVLTERELAAPAASTVIAQFARKIRDLVAPAAAVPAAIAGARR
jgi:flavodoxin